MIVGIFGNMGSGKTLIMSVLGTALHLLHDCPLYANYELKNAKKIGGIKELLGIEDGVVCLDEFWITMDSRNWKDNRQRFLTQWVNQTRKKNLLIFYTTQAMSQIELRIRNGTDIIKIKTTTSITISS